MTCLFALDHQVLQNKWRVFDYLFSFSYLSTLPSPPLLSEQSMELLKMIDDEQTNFENSPRRVAQRSPSGPCDPLTVTQKIKKTAREGKKLKNLRPERTIHHVFVDPLSRRASLRLLLVMRDSPATWTSWWTPGTPRPLSSFWNWLIFFSHMTPANNINRASSLRTFILSPWTTFRILSHSAFLSECFRMHEHFPPNILPSSSFFCLHLGLRVLDVIPSRFTEYFPKKSEKLLIHRFKC